MADSKAHGRFLAFLLFLVLCSVASKLPTAALAGRHLQQSSDSSSLALEVAIATENGVIEKGPRMPPSGPSPGNHPDEPELPAVPEPPSSIALPFPPPQQVPLKQVETQKPSDGGLPLSVEIEKGKLRPPSSPSPGGTI